MKNRIVITLLFLWSCNLFSQDTSNVVPIDSVNQHPESFYIPAKPQDVLVVKVPVNPTVGLGVGLLSYWGDLDGGKMQSPLTSRIGYDLVVKQPLSNNFTLNFNAVYGKLGANERFSSTNSNVNFESEIRSGSVSLAYNFGNFLPADRAATPFVSLGIASFEFLSKTDLYDKYGNKYYYWSDGTIRNMDQNAPNANTAVLLKRDYKYESDVRETNVQRFGKYAERSFAIPVGLGFLFKVNNYIDFRISSTMYFTMTDYIDGVVDNTKAYQFFGKHKNDFFMMSSCGLSYSFGYKKIEEELKDTVPKINLSDADFYAVDTGDRDKDGVPDVIDNCQGTPAGVKVDSVGCPLDDDGDGYPNYVDKEINSPKGAIVDVHGVQLNDSIVALMYKRYTDTSSMANATIEELRAAIPEPQAPKEYVVGLGTFDKGVPTNLLSKFLSVHDIVGINVSGKASMYVAGSFNNLEDAEKRRQEIMADGIPNTKILSKENGVYTEIASEYIPKVAAPVITPGVSAPNESITQNITSAEKQNAEPVTTATITPAITSTVTAEGVTTSTITTAPTVTVAAVPTSTSTVVPITTATTSAAEENKQNVAKEETPAPVKENNQVIAKTEENKPPVSETKTETLVVENKKTEAANEGVSKKTEAVTTTVKNETTPAPKYSFERKVVEGSSKRIFNESGTVFRVQLGAYSRPMSKGVFLSIKDLVEIKTEDGLYKYSTGSFSTVEAAAKTQMEMILKGYEGAFITAYKDGKRITLKEAGATPAEPAVKMVEIPDTVKVNVMSKQLVTFKVQLGVYRGAPPVAHRQIFEQMKEVVTEKTITGLNRYVIGNFTDYVKAEEYRYQLIKKFGVEDPFVVAQYNGEYISVQEALELLR